MKQKRIVIDIETTGLDHHKAEIFSFCVAYEGGKVEVFRNNWRTALEGFLKDTSYEKICHNLKFELSFFQHLPFKIPAETIWHDTMIIAQLLNNLEPSYGLDNLAYKYCQYPKSQDAELEPYLKTYGNRYDRVPENIMHKYQIADGERTMLLFEIMYPYLTGKILLDYQNEIELIKTSLQIENNGIRIHEENTSALLHDLKQRKRSLALDIHGTLGEFMNLGSEIQVSKLLYDRLKIPIMVRTEKGHPSIDKEVLLNLREEYPRYRSIFNLIFKWRSYTTGIAMCKSYLEKMDSNNIIYPTINTNKARTGRESLRSPNLQNVSKEGVLKNPFPVPMRKCFCARDKNFLFSFDYASIELYIIAYLTNCKFYLDGFKNGKEIIYESACIYYGKKFMDETDRFITFRSSAKNATYALPFGAGPEQIAKTLMVSIKEAQNALDRYRSIAPEIVDFSKTIFNSAKKTGYVETLFGRKLRIDKRKLFAGANYLVQGTAAGIFKRAQNSLQNLFNGFYPAYKILVPVHDQLICEAPLEYFKNFRDAIKRSKESIENIDGFDLKLKSKWEISKTTWADLEEI